MEKMSRIYKTRPLLSVEEIIHDEIQSCLNKLQLDSRAYYSVKNQKNLAKS